MAKLLTRAFRLMQAARATLLLDQPFFGSLAYHLTLTEDPTCQTAWTDGASLGFNPQFVEAQTPAALVGLFAHEVMHCADGHPWRRDAREPRHWNVACDYAINPLIKASRMQLPAGALDSPAYYGKSVEWIYDREPRQQGNDGGSGKGGKGKPSPGNQSSPTGQPSADPGAFGEVRDAPTQSADGSPAPTASDWQQATQEAAAAARAYGNLPGHLKRFASDAIAPRTDWRSVVLRFCQERARADYSWRRPNPRYLARRLYLPSLHSEECGAFAFIVDTSGSIDGVMLQEFFGHMQAIADILQPRVVYALYADTRVRGVDEFAKGDPITLHARGGGGTAFQPAIDALSDLAEPPIACVYLTDLIGPLPTVAPDCALLWAVVGDRVGPFGETVRVDR